ncbi:unnamed protein product [Rotaria sp. Silwood2]|nr:unnamed protein product [Rotaria sp. Silwood2]
MPRNKISNNIEGIVKYRLTKTYLYSVIQQELSEMNLNVLKGTISRIANKLGKECRFGLLNKQKPKFYRRRHLATPATVCCITLYIGKENPPTISLMPARCNISDGTAVSIIRDIIRAKYEPFIKYVIPRLSPGDTRMKMILHQDSVPGHTANRDS